METTVIKKLEGKHVLFILFGFFGYMLIANGIFLYVALDTFSGLSTKDAYVKGLNYNAQIEEYETQKARGWHVQLQDSLTGPNKAQLTLDAKDQSGEILQFDEVSVMVKRPTQSDLDFVVIMAPVEGQYTVDIDFPVPGNWDVEIYASGGGYEKPYRLEKRLWVK
jgi:nitrogen fixation protein FixH